MELSSIFGCTIFLSAAFIDVAKSQASCIPPNGIYFGSILTQGPYTTGDIVIFACDSGYAMNGSPYMKCDVTGLWLEAAPSCVSLVTDTPSSLDKNWWIYLLLGLLILIGLVALIAVLCCCCCPAGICRQHRYPRGFSDHKQRQQIQLVEVIQPETPPPPRPVEIKPRRKPASVMSTQTNNFWSRNRGTSPIPEPSSPPFMLPSPSPLPPTPPSPLPETPPPPPRQVAPKQEWASVMSYLKKPKQPKVNDKLWMPHSKPIRGNKDITK